MKELQFQVQQIKKLAQDLCGRKKTREISGDTTLG